LDTKAAASASIVTPMSTSKTSQARGREKSGVRRRAPNPSAVGVAGIGWGVNPLLLVHAQLREGTLIELVPGRTLSVPLFWQHTRLQMPILARLSHAVMAAARSTLRV
jgi:hypothetical protein